MKNISSLLRLFFLLLFVTAGVAVLNGCKKASYNELSEEDLAWIIYGKNDSIHFVSNAGSLLTFYGSYHTRYYIQDGKNYYEGSSIQLLLAGATDPQEGHIIVQRISGGTSVLLNWPHYNGSVDLVNTVQVTDTLFGKVYTDLYVVTAAKTTSQMFIETLYYSKSAGLIRFIDRYGYTWKNLDL